MDPHRHLFLHLKGFERLPETLSLVCIGPLNWWFPVAPLIHSETKALDARQPPSATTDLITGESSSVSSTRYFLTLHLTIRQTGQKKHTDQAFGLHVCRISHFHACMYAPLR